MLEYKELFAIAAVVIGFSAYIPYYRDVFANKTKPHFFSWFIWGLLQGVTFFAQLVSGAGAGAWLNGVGSLLAFSMAAVSLVKGEKEITRLDWWSLIGALAGVVVWIATSNPLYAVIIATAVDAIGYIPTFRKTYMKPHEETVSAWALIVVAYYLNIPAFDTFSVTNLLNPIAIGTVSLTLLVWILVRRAHLKGSTI